MQDPVREKWFEHSGWEFEYRPAVALGKIDIDKSARDQIRIGDEIDMAHAARLSLAYKAKAKLPPIILAQLNGALLLGDGIHRTTGAKAAGLNQLDAYIVTNVADERDLELLRRSVNAIGGKGFDTKQAVEQAVGLCDAGWNAVEAAATMQVSASTVSKRLRARDTVPRVVKATSHAGRVVERLSQEVLDQLGAIQRPDLFKMAADVAVRGRLSGDAVKEMAHEAKRATTDAAAEVLLRRWESMYRVELLRHVAAGKEPGAGAKIKDAPKARLDRAVARLRATITHWRTSIDGAKLDGQSRKHAAKMLRWAGGEFAALADTISAGRGATDHPGSARRTRMRRARRTHLVSSTARPS